MVFGCEVHSEVHGMNFELHCALEVRDRRDG